MATQKRTPKSAKAPRKGARSTATVDAKIRKGLNAGTLETATLSEGLVVDFDVLAKNIGIRVPKLTGEGIVRRMKEMSAHIKNWRPLTSHTSDTVRGWAAYAIAADATLSFEEKLESLRPLAADPHFGVREWAWIAFRPELITNLDRGLKILLEWVRDEDAYVRRFASEITRPRGVWCSHIDALKKNPELARPLLESLKHDPSKYVRNSVSNWLNDAGKSQPAWLRKLAAEWKQDKASEQTLLILKRGLRSL